jgi:hypothetical protein
LDVCVKIKINLISTNIHIVLKKFVRFHDNGKILSHLDMLENLPYLRVATHLPLPENIEKDKD